MNHYFKFAILLYLTEHLHISYNLYVLFYYFHCIIVLFLVLLCQ